ncbi:MAG: ribosome maturation factor RimM [Nevskiales bacterium]
MSARQIDERPEDRRVILGRIGAPFGVRGWVRVQSYTDPLEKIASYANWQLGQADAWQIYRPMQIQHAGGALAVQLADEQGAALTDREAAVRLTNCEIAVWRSELPALETGEYYWTDLIGLEVVNRDGQRFGTIEQILETGANDVLVVKEGKRERLIPFVQGPVVQSVDLPGRRMTVDWDAEF